MFRYAMCNEAFGDTPFVEACRTLRRIGYAGIEIAPFTLAPTPAEVSLERRAELRAIISGEGLEFVGLHWLLVSPVTLHVTTPEPALRARSWNHVRHLIDLCRDLAVASNTVMVFGSPKQRGTTSGSTRADATARFIDGLADLAPHAHERGVTILVEALPLAQCDVIIDLSEAAAVVREIGSPAVQTMFDVHNAIDETDPHPVLLERYFCIIRHVHVNEMDGRHPGTGHYDFAALLHTLTRLDYRGWVSLESFDFTIPPAIIAAETLAHLHAAA